MEKPGPAQARYDALSATRDHYLDRARSCAELTLPFLVPPEDANETTQYNQPYQSVGARGVSTLAAKLLITILPPNFSLFKLQLEEKTKVELRSQNISEGQVVEALSDYEAGAMRYIQGNGYRVPVFEMCRQLIVAGNVLCHMVPGKTGMRVFPLSQFVLKRTPTGQLMEFVVKEKLAPKQIPESIREAVGSVGDSKTVDLYTHGRLEGGRIKGHQEIKGIVVPGSTFDYPEDKSPWIAPRISVVEGEDYGRSYVEEYIGDLNSLETLTKAIVVGSAAAAKVLFFCRPGSVTRATDCNEAASGDFLTGDANDISTLQLEKFNDFRVAAETINEIRQRLSEAFLMHGAVQRDAERVTAEEIRFMASELDDTLGGMYSILAQEFQLPFVKRVLIDAQAKGLLSPLPEKSVTPVIVTGMEALGRTSELQKLDTFVGALFQMSPELAAKYLDISEYLRRRAAALSIDTKGLIRTAEEVAQADQAAQMQAMLQQFGPEVIRQVGNNAKQAQQGAPRG